MRFQELADVLWAAPSGGKPDLLVIMPYYAEYDTLAMHLGFLDKQAFQKFDLIVVMENNADSSKVVGLLRSMRHGFGIIACKRRENTGSAGGYFTGQKYALENGYGYVIMADADCIPEDSKLIEGMYAKRESGFVSATVYGIKGGIRTKFESPSINHYSLLSRSVMERYGLYYVPLYYYAEDGEYLERIKQPRVIIGNFATHPFKIGEEFAKMDKTWYSLLNTIHLMSFNKIVPYLVFFNAMALSFLVFTQGKMREYAAVSLGMLLSFKYGKDAIGRLSAIGKPETVTPQSLPPTAVLVDAKNNDYAVASRRSKIGSMLYSVFSWLRKDVAVNETYSFSGTVLRALFSKRTFVRTGDGYVLLCDNSNLFLHAMRLVVLAISFVPFIAIMTLAYLPIKLVRMPKTLGYGLE
jgi:hypothetical protein